MHDTRSYGVAKYIQDSGKEKGEADRQSINHQ